MKYEFRGRPDPSTGAITVSNQTDFSVKVSSRPPYVVTPGLLRHPNDPTQTVRVITPIAAIFAGSYVANKSGTIPDAPSILQDYFRKEPEDEVRIADTMRRDIGAYVRKLRQELQGLAQKKELRFEAGKRPFTENDFYRQMRKEADTVKSI